jgi:hypothetical protein
MKRQNNKILIMAKNVSNEAMKHLMLANKMNQ